MRRAREGGWPSIVSVDRLDASQAQAVRARGDVVRVFGAPGTGKTTVAVHTVLGRIRSGEATAPQCLIVTSSRVTAAKAREAVTGLFGGTTTEPLAASMQAFGFSVLARQAARGGPQVEAPRLLAGAEQDVILGDLLAGHRENPAAAPHWPAEVADALGTRGFRGELRDLLMRAVEYGVAPGELRDLAGRLGEPAWFAAADVLREYDEVTALSRPGAYDPSWVLGAAAGVLLDDEQEFAALARGMKLLVVDDAQELTAAAAALLGVVASAGVQIVLIGDPDAATQTFRGADPRLFGSGWDGFEMPEPYVLDTRWRQSASTAAVTAEVSRAIGVVGSARHRDALPLPVQAPTDSGRPTDSGGLTEGEVSTVLAGDATAESAHVAAILRRAHLLHGRPWSEMAVIVRGAGRTATLRRVLAAAGVPVDVAGARVPLREETAVKPLLALFELSLARALAPGETTGEAESEGATDAGDVGPGELVLDDLLASPLIGSDTVSARRARRELLRLERSSGGRRRGPQLTAGAVLEVPAGDGTDVLAGAGAGAGAGEVLAPVRALRRVLAAGVKAARTVPTDEGRTEWARGVTCESVLWALWRAAGVEEDWRARALSGAGGASARADRDLDAVLALFEAARAYVDRLPHRGPDGFLEHVLSQEVAADSLAARGQRGEQVALTTPQGAAGREWGLVVVAGLQEGVWPDSRLRGSMLGSERLVEAVTGRGNSVRAQLVDVLHDEARLFVSAVGRARERLILTAVSSDDEQPSAYLDLARAAPPRHVRVPAGAGEEPVVDAVPRSMSMTGLVGELRRRLATTRDPLERRRHAERLAALAAAGVPPADPGTWWAQRGATSESPVRPGETSVRVSPSKLDTFTKCPLRWFFTSAGGESGHPHTASAVGTLVHDIASEFEGDLPGMLAVLEERWAGLELGSGWTARRQWDDAVAMLNRLVAYTDASASEGWHVAAKEIDLRAAIGRADVRGRVDRLEADSQGRLRIIDLKTGRSKPSRNDLEQHPQLGCYQAAVEAGGLPEEIAGPEAVSAGAALVQIGAAGGKRGSVQEQKALSAHDDPDWAVDLVQGAAEGMADSQFTARLGTWCHTCPARRSCPATPEGGSL